MYLSQIAAVAADFAIGKNNELLWHYSEDLKYFKSMTAGKVLIMGRNTFDSLIAMNKKPLPNRFHIVITSKNLKSDNDHVVFVDSVESAYQKAFEVIKNSKNKQTHDVNVTQSNVAVSNISAPNVTMPNADMTKMPWPEEVMIIGGAQIYKQTLLDCRKLYLTFIDKTFIEADTHYPDDFQKFFKRTTMTPSKQHPEVIYSVWEKSDVLLR